MHERVKMAEEEVEYITLCEGKHEPSKYVKMHAKTTSCTGELKAVSVWKDVLKCREVNTVHLSNTHVMKIRAAETEGV